MTKLNHYTQGPHSGGHPSQLIVLLHGYGSNGRDLISLAPYWQDAVPEALFASPDAPFPCEAGMANENMRQWFSLAEYTPEKLREGAEQAAPILNEYLDDLLKEHSLTDENLTLVGFSQGTMMSLYVGPRRKGKISGILGYSGAFVGENELKTQNKPPIHLIHGESDTVVPVTAYHQTRDIFLKNGFSVTGHTTPHLDHSIDGEGIESGADFLSKITNDNNSL